MALITNKPKPELLAPVRDEVSFHAAVNAGANAVYFGLGQLNMRVNSRGIELDILPEIVSHAHANSVKVYIALNVIVYDTELEEVESIISSCKAAGVDAVICWDPAVILLCQKYGIEIHISTQASISNHLAAEHYKLQGATRVVPARELNLVQIAELKNNTSLELEVFVHGAMCVSVSGRCFMSQFVHNRSANRGDCLQPCREKFQFASEESDAAFEIGHGYIMSPKDLCALPVLDQIIATGVDSLKIEDRSRAPEYIMRVVSTYRKAIDAVYDGTFNDDLIEVLMTDLNRAYNRGFSSGFLFGTPTDDNWADKRNSQATEKKMYVGKVLHFYKEPMVAHCRIEALELAVGDKVQIHGSKTGVVETTITELRDDDRNPLNSIHRGTVTFPSDTVLRQNDQIYKIVPPDFQL